MNNQKTIEKLNDILIGERSAVETYIQVLEKVGTDSRSDEVREIKADHMKAVQELSKKIESMGGKPAETSQVWGTFTKAVTATSKIFGDSMALEALKTGENHGLKLYQELNIECKDSDVASEIASVYIPKQKNHLTAIKRYQNDLDNS